MDLKTILSILITIFSLGTVIFGIPAQIIKNHKEKRSGQPLATVLILIGLYLSQIGFFIVTEAYLPLIPFVLGLIFWSITLFQYFLYRGNKPTSAKA